MNGAESMMRAAADAGVDACFANPGTTEMHMVAALDREPRIRPVLGLFEGVVTGAADGYGRMAGRPALTILHLGPGLANGLANLHNARRARTPVVNLVGDHATWHLDADAPLTSDIESLARPMSGWVRTVRDAASAAGDVAAAITASLDPPGAVATLIVPQDATWDPVADDAEEPTVDPARRALVEPARVEEVARWLRADRSEAVLVIGGSGLRREGLLAAVRVAAATGCRLFTEGMPARLERGAGIPVVPRLPYFPEQAVEALADTRVMVLAGVTEPVSFFGYPGQPSRPRPEGSELVSLAGPGHDITHALESLADALDAPAANVPGIELPPLPSGELGLRELGAAIAGLQPEGAIVVDESVTSGLAYAAFAGGAPPHDVLALTGGAIGQGLPTAVGAAVACPDRRVVALQADGSGMYTPQALWTMARESLDVTVVVLANRSYRILQVELLRAGVGEPGPGAMGLTDLARPTIDWVALATGMGVPAERATSADELVEALRRSFATSGPMLVEAVL
ncbi:MAG TPA: acetolactate synthase large subunit [Acidimicrobiales bacterium]|nr:acetolactate synthase large subunit [Acidimicrobiales bacterium]